MSAPFFERLILDKTNLKIINENRPKTSSMSTLKKSFFGQIFNNAKANWLMLVFVVPLIVWLFISQGNQVKADTGIPYNGNLGLGYPIVNDAAAVGALSDMQLAMQRALIMMPLIVIAAVGLAGVFNVIKYLVWGFQIKIIKTFFRGVKNSFAPFLWVGMMLAVCFLLFTFVLNAFKVYTDVHLAWQILSYAAVIVVTLFVFLLSVFVTTQAAVFNLTLFEILKNSFLLGTRFAWQCLLIALIGLVSMTLPLLTFNTPMTLISNMLFFMLGFSWTATVWTIFSHYMFDMIYSQKSEQKPAVVQIQPQKAEEPKKDSVKKVYQNPKKKKKQ